MFIGVLPLGEQGKIVYVVVHLVSVFVMNDHPARDRAMMLFPDVLAEQPPAVWFGDLDPLSLFSTPLVSGVDVDRADRKQLITAVSF